LTRQAAGGRTERGVSSVVVGGHALETMKAATFFPESGSTPKPPR